MMLMSRTPIIDMWRVRGMGVAVKVRTSTLCRSSLRRSFWATPKRCSSSTITSPRSLKTTSFESRRWVPMTMSTVPAASPFKISVCSLGFESGKARGS